MLRFRALFFPLRFSRSSFPHPTPCFGRCAPVLAFRPASASHFDPRTPARTPVLHSGPVFREGRLLRFEPALRSSHPVLALLSPYSCLRTPASALLPPHPGPHSGPVFRAAYPGPVLRPRPAPHILPHALGGGFEGRILEGGFRVPGSSSGPRVLALCSGPHNPVLAPRLLAFRPASASHFDPRTPARTPVLHSGPVFREGRLLRFEPALRSSRTDPRTPPSHPALAPRPRTRPRASAHAPRLALRSRVPGGALRSRAPVPCSGRRTPVPCSDPDLPPTFCPALWVADSGGGSCPRAPSRISFRVPALAPRLLHSRPAFRAAVLKGGFRATFWNVAFRAAVLKEGFRATFWNVAFRAAVLKEGGYAAVPV